MEVMQHFNNYMDIPQIKELSDQVFFSTIFNSKYSNQKSYFLCLQVQQIHIELAQQIIADFKEAFCGQNPKHFAHLTDGCLVLSVLDPKVK